MSQAPIHFENWYLDFDELFADGDPFDSPDNVESNVTITYGPHPGVIGPAPFLGNDGSTPPKGPRAKSGNAESVSSCPPITCVIPPLESSRTVTAEIAFSTDDYESLEAELEWQVAW